MVAHLYHNQPQSQYHNPYLTQPNLSVKMRMTTIGDHRKMGLKFLHIPKSAGTSLENIANDHGFKWGRFDREYLQRFKSNVETNINVWHRPLHFFSLNPYQNYRVFAVIRDPYDRIISDFKYLGVKKGWGSSVEDLNLWIPRLMEELAINPMKYDGHFIPQSRFLTHGHRKMVDHILQFENLTEEFNDLMVKYDLPMRLTRHDNPSNGLVTSDDLTLKNKQLIYHYYKEDFRGAPPPFRTPATENRATHPLLEPHLRRTGRHTPF